MIVSHKYKFIFIKTAKTAGTSIEIFMSQCCGCDDVVTPIFPPVESHQPRNYRGLWNPIPEIFANKGRGVRRIVGELARCEKFYNHISAKLARQRLPGRVWDGYFKFCVERNPWDKTLSHYHMVKERLGYNLSFEDYLERGKFCINYHHYTDERGKLLVDRVVKYESFLDELGDVFRNLGVPFDGTLGASAKGEYRKDKRHYRDIYTDAQREMIGRAFVKEIELHGYEF